MRGGLSGFLIFLTCIALGVAAIGGVNSVARSITAGVAEEGQSLLGGDIRFELNQRQATDTERAFLEGLGTLATSANMRSMARLEDGSDQALVEAKAVDAAYPLYGALVTEPALPREELFGETERRLSARRRPTFCSSGWAYSPARASSSARRPSSCAPKSSPSPTRRPTVSASRRG